MENCKVVGGCVRGKDYVGGLIGRNNNFNNIVNCSSTSTVDATGTFVGGLIGVSNYGDMSLCFAKSNVSGNKGVGGLFGFTNDSFIRDSYSHSNVSGVDSVGGLIGDAWNEMTIIADCYSAGSVIADTNVGGLIGKGLATVSDSYWDIQQAPLSFSIGGGLPKTADEMKDIQTFKGWASIEPNVWTIDDGNDYPRLALENIQGIIITKPESIYGGGTGEPNDPYLIYTPGQLNSIGLFEDDWNKHFVLMDNIDMQQFKDSEFNVIGHRISFSGLLNGSNYSILNFNYNSIGRQYNGLIGKAGNGAVLENIVLIDPNISIIDGSCTGLIGVIVEDNVTVKGCKMVDGNVFGGDNTGGIIGRTFSSSNNEVKCCSVSSNIHGENNTGGIAGFFSEGVISECFSTGSVNGNEDVGGLVGQTNATASIIDCYSKSNVTGDRRVGGLIGYGYNRWFRWNDLEVLNCYSTGRVIGNEKVGGLFGETYELDYDNTFWDVDTSGIPDPHEGAGITTYEMKEKSTFLDANWDFDNIWDICQSVSYPRLRWQILPADIVCPYGVDNIDFAYLASSWKNNACNSSNGFCQGSDLNESGVVDAGDLAVFAEQWLKEKELGL